MFGESPRIPALSLLDGTKFSATKNLQDALGALRSLIEINSGLTQYALIKIDTEANTAET